MAQCTAALRCSIRVPRHAAANTVQQNQPPGVPPLRADRRADAARRAGGELLVPAPPGRLRVDRGAGRRAAGRRHGLRRGLRLQRARRSGRRGRRRRRQPGGPRARPAALRGAPTCASSATWSRASPSPATRSSSCRRSSTSQDPGAILEHFAAARRRGVAYVSTPNLLTLAPPGAEKSDNPWHVREYRAAEFRALCEPHFAAGRAARRSSTPASCASTSWRSGSAGTASTSALGLTKPFYDRFTPAISASDFALAPRGDLDRALDFLAVCHA